MLLEIDNLTKLFGGLTAIDNISLRIAEGEIVGLIGPNGAGKTTLFNVISGFSRPSQGAIVFEGRTSDRPQAPQDSGPGHYQDLPDSTTVRLNDLHRKCGDSHAIEEKPGRNISAIYFRRNQQNSSDDRPDGQSRCSAHYLDPGRP